MRDSIHRRSTGTIAAICVIGLLALAPSAGAHGRIHGPKRRLGSTTSTNWSGYAIDGTGASSVTGSWTVQPAQCQPGETSWSSPWVGIDGDNSSTVEQTGTDTDCNGGTPSYYAWWEMYPKPTMVIDSSTHPLIPFDSMTGKVDYAAGSFTLTLVDHTQGWTFTTKQSSSKAPRSSVEWIAEGPSTGTLTDFGTLNFSVDSATINGTSGSLQSFGTAANPITMATKKGVVRAAPGPVGSGGSFADTWHHG